LFNAGHSLQAAGQDYLVPIDAEVASPLGCFVACL